MPPSELARVDRIDANGDIREHVLNRATGRTLCGLALTLQQPPTENARCRRCEVLSRHRPVAPARYQQPSSCVPTPRPAYAPPQAAWGHGCPPWLPNPMGYFLVPRGRAFPLTYLVLIP